VTTRKPRPINRSADAVADRFDPDRLRGYRHARSTDRRALANRAGLTLAELDAIETGTTTPDPATVARLAEALDCTPADLHGHPGEPPNAGYWAATTAAMPPLTPAQIAAVATALDRIPNLPRD